MKQKFVVFCDFDGTILDTDAFLQNFRDSVTNGIQENEEKFTQIYEQHKSQPHEFLQHIAKAFFVDVEKLRHEYFEADISTYLRPGAKKFLDAASTHGSIKVITKGDPEFQMSKLKRVGIPDGIALEKKTPYIGSQITEAILNNTHCYVIDDKVAQLEAVLSTLTDEQKQHVTFIHMKTGRHAEKGTYSPELSLYLKTAVSFEQISRFIGLPEEDLRNDPEGKY